MLSLRLQTVASLVDQDAKVADIGADHGKLEQFLLENKIVSKIYASDNKEGPYTRLKEALKFYPDARIDLVDGLDNLPKDIDTVILTGMGGSLIMSILESDKDKLNHVDTLILSPQSEQAVVRKFLHTIGYVIVEEKLVIEDQYYLILKCQKGDTTYSELELKYGPILLKNRPENLISYLNERKNVLFNLLNKNLDVDSKMRYQNELDEINLVLRGDYSKS